MLMPLQHELPVECAPGCAGAELFKSSSIACLEARALAAASAAGAA